MEKREIKETREFVVKTEYVAADGKVFMDEQECKKYEKSALFVVSNKLKRITNKPITYYDINDNCSDEDVVEIFDIQTENDLDNLKKYLYLKLKDNGESENTVKQCFGLGEDNSRIEYTLDNVTIRHEVMIFWNFDQSWFWVYRDGSIESYLKFFEDKIKNLLLK